MQHDHADVGVLTLLVEADRSAVGDVILDVRCLERGVDGRRLVGFRPLDGIRRDLDRLVGKHRVEVEARVHLLLEAVGYLTGALLGRIVPRHAGHIAVAVFPERVGERLLVGARATGADDAHRRPVLLHHLADDQDRIADAGDRHQQVGTDRLGLGHLDR